MVSSGTTLQATGAPGTGSGILDLEDVGPHRITTTSRAGRQVAVASAATAPGSPPLSGSRRHSLSPNRQAITSLSTKRDLSSLSASTSNLSLASPSKKSRVRPSRKSTASTKAPVVVDNLYKDKLGTLVRESVKRLEGSKSWKEFVDTSRGRPYLHEDVKNIPHPAAEFLEDLRLNGVPAKTNAPPLEPQERDNQYWRGAHASAEMNRAFVREEMAEFMECGYWTVLPYRLVRDLPGLRISPLGVKEERERKPRLVCDHSFFGVNQHTLLRTPPEAMQFGGALHRILHAVRHADPKWGPVRLSKYDIKDGFYRLLLEADDAPMLAVTLPRYEGEEPLIAIPLVLTMGWAESPPTFCSMSETICDLANAQAYRNLVPPHRLEEHCSPLDQWMTEEVSTSTATH